MARVRNYIGRMEKDRNADDSQRLQGLPEMSDYEYGYKTIAEDGTQRYKHIKNGVTTHWIKRSDGEWSKSALDVYIMPGPMHVDPARVIWSCKV